MAAIRPIRTEEDYEAALARISELMDALSPPEGQIEDEDDPGRLELDVLSDLVERYEDKHYPIGLPSVTAAIEFQMDQMGMTQRDLIPFLGSSAKVSEILSGKRSITMAMARALHRHLRIPADLLLQEPGATLPEELPGFEWTRFPLKAMARAGWIPDIPDLKDRAEELIGGLIDRAGGREFATQPMYRRNDQRRINAKTDDYALQAWCWQVIARAREPAMKPRPPSAVTPEFLREVARLSTSEDGPVRARDFLAGHGIGLEYVPHLPRTHLDGAALRLPDGRPVVGLTLRYDRIDNFWFTLLHELGHVGLHLGDGSDETGFVDDLSLRGVESGGTDPTEHEADQLAQDALVPAEVWDDGTILENPGPMAVLQMSWEAQVHPAVIAGRVRHESGNYRLLSQFVGTGEVRRQFEGG